jgi:hypothetical protein
MRYITKWNNGYWKVFDTVQYTDVQLCGLFTEAKAVAQRLNNRG